MKQLLKHIRQRKLYSVAMKALRLQRLLRSVLRVRRLRRLASMLAMAWFIEKVKRNTFARITIERLRSNVIIRKAARKAESDDAKRLERRKRRAGKIIVPWIERCWLANKLAAHAALLKQQVPEAILAPRDSTTDSINEWDLRELEQWRTLLTQPVVMEQGEFYSQNFVIHNKGNPNTIDWYIENSMYQTEEGLLLVAPCGLGKSKFAPGKLMKKLGFSKLVMLTERISSTLSSYNWYAERGLENITGCIMRAGGKTMMWGKNHNMWVFTTNAWVDGKMWTKLTPDTLVLLDEAHNNTSGTFMVLQNVPKRQLLQTTATPPYQGIKLDLATPMPSKIMFSRTIVTVPEDIEQWWYKDTKSMLVIVPSMRLVDDCIKIAEKLKYVNTIIKFTRNTKATNKGKAVAITDLEALTNQDGVIVVATDILQESVTLGCTTVIDFGKRVRPVVDAPQQLRNNTITPDLDLDTINNRLGPGEIFVDISAAEIGQVAGRVGRTPRTSGGLCVIATAPPTDKPRMMEPESRLHGVKVPGCDRLAQADIDKLAIVTDVYNANYRAEAKQRRCDRYWDRYKDLKVGTPIIGQAIEDMVLSRYSKTPKLIIS